MLFIYKLFALVLVAKAVSDPFVDRMYESFRNLNLVPSCSLSFSFFPSTPEKTTVTRISQWDPKLTMMPWFVQNNHSLKWYAGRCIDFKKTAESLPPEDLKKMTKDVGFYDHVVKQLETPM